MDTYSLASAPYLSTAFLPQILLGPMVVFPPLPQRSGAVAAAGAPVCPSLPLASDSTRVALWKLADSPLRAAGVPA